jgi:Cytochrome oxidase complex assembly protein 1
MNQPPLPPQPPQRSWWSRNWKWALPVGCLLPIVLCGGGFVLFFSLIFGAVTGAIRNSDAYQEGMSRARSNPDVVAALGEPIESGFWISGSINVDGPSGNVDVSIPISGPKGSGTLYIVGTRNAGRWQYSTMEVEIPGRAGRIDVRPRAP